MELKLIVLAGAKVGTEIPLKKDEFFIGRAKECTLRAGSEAISRRHCSITRSGDVWSVQDLKSRNGTYVNDQRIEQSTPLAPGDELRVGPLKFRVDARDAAVPPAKSVDIPRGKQSAVKDVADLAQRTAAISDGSTTEDDISRWLLGVADGKPGDSLKETRTIRMEETTTMNRPTVAPVEASASSSDAAAAPAETDDATTNGQLAKSSALGWLKRGKSQPKQKPGKLPPRPAEQSSKDSREAAADILREMQRRR
jgi:pSer/pThr/pTyr-binding forkhead associated (FHA) protein